MTHTLDFWQPGVASHTFMSRIDAHSAGFGLLLGQAVTSSAAAKPTARIPMRKSAAAMGGWRLLSDRVSPKRKFARSRWAALDRMRIATNPRRVGRGWPVRPPTRRDVDILRRALLRGARSRSLVRARPLRRRPRRPLPRVRVTRRMRASSSGSAYASGPAAARKIPRERRAPTKKDVSSSTLRPATRSA